MMRGERIEELATSAYRGGIPPLDFAEVLIQAVAEDTTGCSHCSMLLARKVIAGLIDAGWIMPETAKERP